MSSSVHLPELDVLRSQVADLSRRLAEQDRSAQDLRGQSDQLRAIVEGTAAETGEEFFAALVRHLTTTLHIKYAVIGEVQGNGLKKIRTLAVSAGGVLVDNFEYELTDTNCATALTQTFACFNRDVQAMFPQFQRLVDLGAESYCAVPIRTKGGAVIGLLVVMDTKPLEHSDALQSLLGVFAPRVAAEFERRRVEQERVQALADLHNVMETVPDILFTLNTQGNLVNWNRHVEEVTGYSQEELLNKPALAFVPLEEQARTAAAIQQAFTEGYAELEGHLLTKERRLIPYHWTGALLKNSQGESIGITGVGRDVSDKKRVEASLRASEERYRVLYDETPTMYFTLATDGTVLSVNRFGAEQLGYRVEELIGYSVLNLFHEGDKEAVLSSLSECLANPEETGHWAFRKVRKDGSIVWVRETVRVGQSSSEETVVLVTCEDITERRQVEDALRKTEQYNRILFENSPIGLVTCRLDGTIMDCNERYIHILGRSRSEVLGKTYWELTSKKYDDQARAVMEGMCRMGRFGPYEKEYIHADGHLVPVRLFGALIEKDGELFAICSVEDITERKRAEKALRLAKFSMERAADAVYWIDPQAKILDVNEAASRMLGYSKDELCAMTVHDLNPDFQADMWPGFWAETQRRGTMVFETTHRAKAGRLIPIEVSVNYLSHEGKEYHCAFARDISERKQAEQEQVRLIEDLTRSRQHFQALFNWTPSAVGISTMPEGRFIDVNEGFSRLTGYAREEVVGRTTLELGLWADPLERESALREIQEQGALHNREGRLRTKSGEIRSLMVSIHSINLGSIPCLIYLGHDITERKRMEDALRQREHDLKTALHERERISQNLHDGILQSLFAVGLALEVSKSKMSPRALKTSGASLDQAIDQLNRVMREIRNFIAGLDSDLLEGKDLPTALQYMLKSLTENQATRVRLAVENRAAKAISVEQSLHLLHVIQEAVSNCIRHSRAHEARVSLKMLKQGVRLSIRDNGRGFDEDAVKGVGHGLANMAARAKKIGGRFTILSKANEGTRIVFDLPNEMSDAPH